MATKKVKEVEEVKEEVATKTIVEEKIPENIKDDEIYISGRGLVKLKSTKLKYFKNGAYNNYMMIKAFGVNEVLRYDDGEKVIIDFIAAVLDIDSSQVTFLDEMSTGTLFELIEKINKINEIKDTDFLTSMTNQGVTNQD
jgi:hypothetical protein